MTKCANCDGSGLAGAGDKPWLHQGAVGTCTICKGVGQIPNADLGVSPTDEVAQTENADVTPAGEGRTDAEANAAAIADGSIEIPKGDGSTDSSSV